MLRISVASIFLLASSTQAQEHCEFIVELGKVLTTDPVAAAKNLAHTEPGKFLSIGNGYAPARPGFGSQEEMVCAMQHHGFNMIWAGGDVGGCENQVAIGKEMEVYAEKYNQQIKSMLIEQGGYRCDL